MSTLVREVISMTVTMSRSKAVAIREMSRDAYAFSTRSTMDTGSSNMSSMLGLIMTSMVGNSGTLLMGSIVNGYLFFSLGGSRVNLLDSLVHGDGNTRL